MALFQKPVPHSTIHSSNCELLQLCSAHTATRRKAKELEKKYLTRSGAVEIIGSGTFEAHSRSCCAMFSAM